MTARLSVVVPSVGRWDRLRLALEHAGATLAGLAEAELILTVEGWTEVPDDVAGTLATLDEAQLLLAPERHGRAANRNRGARAARGEIICFLDEDMICSPGWASAHRQRQQRTPGIAAGPVGELLALALVPDLDAVPRAQGSAGGRRSAELLRALSSSFDECWERHAVLQPLQRLAPDGEPGLLWAACSGANLSVHRDVLARHRFDERTGTTWGLEDLGFALAAMRDGVTVGVAPAARAMHLAHPQRGWREAQRRNRSQLDPLKGCLREPALAVIERRADAESLDRWRRALAEAGGLFDG